MNEHPYRMPPSLPSTEYRVLVYALVASVIAALGFAGIALALALARPPSAAVPATPSTPVVAMETPTCPVAVAAPIPPLSETLAKVRLSSEPEGASVKEDGVDLCSSTPCDILYKGADAEPARPHVLTIARSGFRTQTVTVRPPDSPIRVTLMPVTRAAAMGLPF